MKASDLRRLLRIAAVLGPRLLLALPARVLSGRKGSAADLLCGGFEKLGPAFLKAGQFLSVRPDLIGAESAEAFSRLRDNAAPLPAGIVEELVQKELGAPVGRLFADFDRTPLACASLSQVHRATTLKGVALVLKVQRPGAEESLEGDFALLNGLAVAASRLGAFRNTVDLPALVAAMREGALRETDFRLEAEVAERFRLLFSEDPRVKVPRVHWEFTTQRLLASEYLEGWKISDPRARAVPGYERLAEAGATLFFTQVLVHGLFHADLHPSNVFLTKDGRIGYLDFGIWGVVDDSERQGILTALAGLLLKDEHLALRGLARLGVVVPAGKAQRFSEEVGRVLAQRVGATLGQTETLEIGRGILAAVRNNGVLLPHKYALLVKALLTVEGAARTLHPGFDMEGAARDFLAGSLPRRLGILDLAELYWRALLVREAVGA